MVFIALSKKSYLIIYHHIIQYKKDSNNFLFTLKSILCHFVSQLFARYTIQGYLFTYTINNVDVVNCYILFVNYNMIPDVPYLIKVDIFEQ
jgi:hypothetical protein